MILQRLALLSTFAFLAVAGPLQAQTSVPTDLYNSPGLIPSGDINLVPGSTDGSKPLSTDAESVKDTDNYLGCGGVGQAEFTNGVYNMEASFEKFQLDANSLLAKQLVAMNFVMPQTAALFDQLNNYGNQRYQTFQKSCNLDALRKDAKDRYLAKCVEDNVKKMKGSKPDGAGGGGGGDAGKFKLDEDSIKRAQAWEMCENQYASEKTMLDDRKKSLKEFAEKIRSVENVTLAIQPLLCESKLVTDGKKGDESVGKDNACWLTLLTPQVRLCLDGSLGCDNGGYMVKEAQLPMIRLFDLFRFIMDDRVVNRWALTTHQQMTKNRIDMETQKKAATQAALQLSAASLARARATEVVDTVTVGQAASSPPSDANVQDFQLNYLNCKNPDVSSPLKILTEKINTLLSAEENRDRQGQAGTDYGVTPITLASSDFRNVINAMNLPDTNSNQQTGLEQISWAALGCAVNQSVPMFDPNIVVSLQTQCEQADRYAFYSIASNDVALAATRDVYRYLSLRLKQVYARLLTDATVPNTESGADNVVSPEINARLAKVVKEAMIPQVEDQIARLEELQRTRGAFAQRVQQIYQTKSGCMNTPAASGSGSSGGGGSSKGRFGHY